ncbi:hypothetical protein ACFQZO_13840 [Bradyrhizobium sp. GCM10027634]|uniref:hypothetical protein n=1 Tax=unclassified Bradyrhizobium TaxID=2631580 RepID=UPI00188D735E|nr:MULTISPECIES: hypothetical protein [unclassified Bradyrhizobium]MDN5001970.1 hypothetical protein [Bradyrhizobium sp. WYCCWR 12677]QOZ45750.1 hypothetical protein XH89_21390 [Bradyrhizobium sp. CCBAU 53340]
MGQLSFRKLNEGWNAEPNAPWPHVAISGHDVLLSFLLNPFQFTSFAEEDQGILRFSNCVRYRLGATNDEGWSRGQCRYSKLAPRWGEFYEIAGCDPHMMDPIDWELVGGTSTSSRHFLFYFRDETFECMAADWTFEPVLENALIRKLRVG